MQQVETAVGEDHAPAIAFLCAKLQNRFVQTQDSSTQLPAPADTTRCLTASKQFIMRPAATRFAATLSGESC
jgi:hypothetical protein